MVMHDISSRKGTGGGPCKLNVYTTLEERVVELLELRSGIPGKGIGFGVPINKSTSLATSQCDTENIIRDPECDNVENINELHQVNETTEEIIASPPRKSSRSRTNKTQSTRTLLQRQVESQEKFHVNVIKHLKDIRCQKRDLLRYAKKTYTLAEENLKDTQNIG